MGPTLANSQTRKLVGCLLLGTFAHFFPNPYYLSYSTINPFLSYRSLRGGKKLPKLQFCKKTACSSYLQP